MLNTLNLAFRTLHEKSIHESLTGMGQRAVVAGLIQMFLYPTIMYNTPGLSQSSWIVVGAAMMFMVCVSRLLQLKFGHKVLKMKNGVTLWRIWFAFGAQGISIAWGASCAYSFVLLGMTPASSAILVICLGTTALYSASYAFDLVNNFLFQIFMVLPTAVVLIAVVPDAGSNEFAIAGFLYMVFSLNMASNMSKSQVQTLRNVEILEEQEQSLRKAHYELRSNHELINAMLANIDQGFLILDFDGTCRSIASQRSKQLLGIDPMGKHVTEILRHEGEQATELTEWFNYLIDPSIAFEAVRDLGPQMLKIKENESTIKLEFHPLRSGTGDLYAIILTALDVTQKLRAEQELKEAHQRADLIVRVVENRLGFRSILTEIESVIQQMMTWKSGDFVKLKRDLHTYKGGANMFGALAIGQLIYEVEVSLGAAAENEREKSIREQGALLNAAYEKWKSSEFGLFSKLGVFEGNRIEIPMDRLQLLESKYNGDATARKVYQDLLHNLMFSEFGDLLKDFEGNVLFASQKTGKKVRMVIDKPAQPLYVCPTAYSDVLRVLVHMMNNSVDHGIEMPEERAAAGKSETGTIRLSYQVINQNNTSMIELLIRDDGHGINANKLRERLTKQGRSAEGMTDLQVAHHIFDDGMSTSEKVSALSGQGIGMGAVYAAVVASGGQIQIRSTDKTGTTFAIHIPLIAGDSQRHLPAA